MIDIYLIRHSMTKGNLEHRYIGSRTDEPLCEAGVRLLSGVVYPPVDRVFASPMRRCTETAKLLWPDVSPVYEDRLRECDFGDFENKNYLELSHNQDYQKWIDSGGAMAFPGGESQEEFRKRCREGFYDCVESCIRDGVKTAAFVVHGGTIMSILSACGVPAKDYFSWQVKNGEGFLVRVDKEFWSCEKTAEVLRKLEIESGRTNRQ